MEADAQAGTDKEVVGGFIESGSRSDIELHVVIEQVREAAVEVVLDPSRVGTVREQRIPLGVRPDVVRQRVSDRPGLRPFRVGVARSIVNRPVELRAAGR